MGKMMQIALLFSTVLLLALAKPNGLYHQEYQFQASSSSYRNNELQHKNDDEGYYSRDGDLEGRLKPKINSHNQHTEYINPKLKQGYDSTASVGQLQPHNTYGQNMPYIQSDMGGGLNYLGQQSYADSSNLRQITTSLQQELERELQNAVYDHHRKASSYSSSISQEQFSRDSRALEEELRRNMTLRLQEALRSQYGNQGIRGGYSYSIINGRFQPTANYNSQELTDLSRQLQDNLLKHLDQQMRSYYQTSSSVHTSRNTYQNINDNYPSAVQQRPIIYQPPSYPQPMYPQSQSYSQPMYPQSQSYSQTTSESLTSVASRTQNDLNEQLNKALNKIQSKYFFSGNQNAGYDYDSILTQLQQELKANITQQFVDQIRYGPLSSKYNNEDVENLRKQIESNLLTKLNRDFATQKQNFFQSYQLYENRPQTQVYHPTSNVEYLDLSDTQRQLQEQLSGQLQAALMKHSYRQAHGYSTNSQANYQATLDQLQAELNRNLTRQMEQLSAQHYQSSQNAAQLANMRNQLQQDLSRQLQQGLQQSYSSYSSWSSSSSSSSRGNYRPVRGFDSGNYQQSGSTGLNMAEEDCMMGDDPSSYQHQDTDGDLTQQTEDLTQQVQEPEDLTQQVQTHDDLTQQVQTSDELTQQPDNQDENLTQQVEVPEELNQTEDLLQLSQVALNPSQAPRGTSPYRNRGYSSAHAQGTTAEDSSPQTQEELAQQNEPNQAEDLMLGSQSSSQQPLAPSNEQPFRRQHINHYSSSAYSSGQHSYYPITSPYESHLPRSTLVRQRVHYYDGLQRTGQRYESGYSSNTYSRSVPQRRTQTYVDFSQQTHITDDFPDTSRPTRPGLGQQPTESASASQQTQKQLGQQIEDSDLTQQSEVAQPNTYSYFVPPRRIQTGVNLSQQTQTVNRPGLSQQTEESALTSQQTQKKLGQQTDEDSDQILQTEDVQYENSHQSNTYSKPISPQRNQATEDLSHLTQTVEENQNTSRLIQQTEDDQYGPSGQPNTYSYPVPPRRIQTDLHVSQQSQAIEESQDTSRLNPHELGQQTQESAFSPQQTQKQLGQEIEDSDLIQQTEDVDYGTPAIGSQQQQPGQQIGDSYLTQQNQGTTYGKLGLDKHRQVTESEQANSLQTQNVAQLANTVFSNVSQPGYESQQNHEVAGQQIEEGFNRLIQQQQHQYQTQDWGQQIEDDDFANPTLDNQQSSNVGQTAYDLTKQNNDYNQGSDDLPFENQHLTQQTEDLGQTRQDTTLQIQSFKQQSQYNELPIEPQVNTNKIFDDEQTQQLTQQTQDFIQQEMKNNEQVEDETQTIPNEREQIDEQQPDQQSQNIAGTPPTPGTQQIQDSSNVNQSELGQEIYDSELVLQQTENSQTNRQLTNAERESQRLIDLLKSKKNQSNQGSYVNDNAQPEYPTEPVYSYVDGHLIQVSTTRQQPVVQPAQVPTYGQRNQIEEGYYRPKPVYSSSYGNPRQIGTTRRLQNPSQTNYATIQQEEEISGTVREIEPVSPEVAHEVQPVVTTKGKHPTAPSAEIPVEPETEEATTKPPGWWSRLGTSIKNKAHQFKEQIG